MYFRFGRTSKSQRSAPVGSPHPVKDVDSSSSMGSSSDEEALPGREETPAPRHSQAVSPWIHTKLPSCRDVYGFSLSSPNRADAVLYSS